MDRICILFFFSCVATEWPLRIRGYERDYVRYYGGYVHGGYHQQHRHRHRLCAYHNQHSVRKHGWGGRGGGTGKRGC